jgi:transcriptional regulator with XRE-family HTH domain
MALNGGGKSPAAIDKQREIGERIRRLRKDKLRLDQAELARQLGVSHGAVSYWERGGNLTPMNFRRLAEFAGVTVEYLTNGQDATADPRIRQLTDRLAILQDDHLERYIRTFNEMLDFRETLLAERLKSNREKTPGD